MKTLLEIELELASVRQCRERVVEWPDSHTKLWTIQLYDNYTAKLTRDYFYAIEAGQRAARDAGIIMDSEEGFIRITP